MKTSVKSHLWISVAIILFCFCLVAFSPGFQKSWVVPVKYKKRKNPTTASSENLVVAKFIWTKQCEKCHGNTGLGDGPSASRLKVPFKDFSSKAFQSQSDGEIFYKMIKGRGYMPACERKISTKENWMLVHYIRTLKAYVTNSKVDP